MASDVLERDVTLADTETDSEIRLLRRIASGEQDAFESIFRCYYERLYRFAFRMLNQHDLADEVVSDALQAVWTGAARFRGDSSVSTWIFGITYRTGLKALKKQSVRGQRFVFQDDADLARHADESVNPEEMLNARQELGDVVQALQSLSVEQRTVAELTAMGHSCSDIATIVDCPVNTVKTRMFHVRKRLQTLVQRNPDTK